MRDREIETNDQVGDAGSNAASQNHVIPLLDPDDPFPPVERALREPNGLLAAGGDLSPARLLDAYAHGIFPWFGDDDPVLWWSPDPRMVLSRARAARLALAAQDDPLGPIARDAGHRVSRRSMDGCAEPRPGQDGTWITPR